MMKLLILPLKILMLKKITSIAILMINHYFIFRVGNVSFSDYINRLSNMIYMIFPSEKLDRI